MSKRALFKLNEDQPVWPVDPYVRPLFKRSDNRTPLVMETTADLHPDWSPVCTEDCHSKLIGVGNAPLVSTTATELAGMPAHTSTKFSDLVKAVLAAPVIRL